MLRKLGIHAMCGLYRRRAVRQPVRRLSWAGVAPVETRELTARIRLHTIQCVQIKEHTIRVLRRQPTARAVVRLGLIWLVIVLSGTADSQPAASAASGPSAAGADRRPNIVLILADDMRADAFEAGGHPFLKTPHLDRLAREGAMFERSFVVTSLCCPSRASLLTGLYTHRTGVTANINDDLDYARTPIVAAPLKAAGYATGFVGKYHLGNSGTRREGFDYWVAYDERIAEPPYFNARLMVGEKAVATTGYSTDVLCDYATRWIEQQGDRPFFLMLAVKNPHFPLEPPPADRESYADAAVQLPPGFGDPIESLPRGVRGTAIAAPIVGPDAKLKAELERLAGRGDAIRELSRDYSRMIPSIDRCVGRVLDALERRKALDDTLVIFTSDNGLMLGERGVLRKAVPYEPSIRVPLLMRYPRLIRGGTRIDRQALNIDLCPTILSAAHAPPAATTSGRDLTRLFKHPKDDWREDWLYLGPYGKKERPRFLAVRTASSKYALYLDGMVEEELFDLVGDPAERRNLAGRTEHAALLTDMRKRLESAMEREGVPAEWRKPLAPRKGGREAAD